MTSYRVKKLRMNTKENIVVSYFQLQLFIVLPNAHYIPDSACINDLVTAHVRHLGSKSLLSVTTLQLEALIFLEGISKNREIYFHITDSIFINQGKLLLNESSSAFALNCCKHYFLLYVVFLCLYQINYALCKGV